MFRGPGGLLFQVETGALEILAASSDGTGILKALHIQQATDPSESTVWGFEEVWNLSLEPDSWREPDFDDSAWAAPIAARYAPSELVPVRFRGARPPRLRERERRSHRGRDVVPGSLLVVEAGVPGGPPDVVFDFGREAVGYPRLKPDGCDAISSCRTARRSTSSAAIRSHNGRKTWSPYHRRALANSDTSVRTR